jgi:hypothetical protein
VSSVANWTTQAGSSDVPVQRKTAPSSTAKDLHCGLARKSATSPKAVVQDLRKRIQRMRRGLRALPLRPRELTRSMHLQRATQATLRNRPLTTLPRTPATVCTSTQLSAPMKPPSSRCKATKTLEYQSRRLLPWRCTKPGSTKLGQRRVRAQQSGDV